jgi:hypothetical protein
MPAIDPDADSTSDLRCMPYPPSTLTPGLPGLGFLDRTGSTGQVSIHSPVLLDYGNGPPVDSNAEEWY